MMFIKNCHFSERINKKLILVYRDKLITRTKQNRYLTAEFFFMRYFKLQALNDHLKDRLNKSVTEKSLNVIKHKCNHICIKKSLGCKLLKTERAF